MAQKWSEKKVLAWAREVPGANCEQAGSQHMESAHTFSTWFLTAHGSSTWQRQHMAAHTSSTCHQQHMVAHGMSTDFQHTGIVFDSTWLQHSHPMYVHFSCTTHTIYVHVYVQHMVSACTSACTTHTIHVHVYVQHMESACTSACTTHTNHRVPLPCSSCSLPPPFVDLLPS